MLDLLERLQEALADRYAVEREVGRGGMAVVFLADHLKHHRQVALKVLHPELTATLGAERFLQEIEFVSGLDHPNILPLHESGEADELLYYVMPHVAEGSLRDLLSREKQLPTELALRTAREVAEGLEYAHASGIVHRDIKPSNIMLSAGHARIADFGVAGSLDRMEKQRLTQSGLAIGSPAYMSPEQAGGERVDRRTDIYSLGCVLFEMLAGEPPFAGSNPRIVYARRLSERPVSLTLLRDTVPDTLDMVVRKCLTVSPADRYQTATELHSALDVRSLVITEPVRQVAELENDLSGPVKQQPLFVRAADALFIPVGPLVPARRIKRTLGLGLLYLVTVWPLLTVVQFLAGPVWPVVYHLRWSGLVAVLLITWVSHRNWDG